MFYLKYPVEQDKLRRLFLNQTNKNNNVDTIRTVSRVAQDLNKYKKQIVYILDGLGKGNGYIIIIDGEVYCVSVAHLFNNTSIYIKVAFSNVNGSGQDKILRFQLIGFERNTDVALLKYYPDLNSGFLLDPVYYNELDFQNQVFQVVYNDEVYALANVGGFGGVSIQRLLVKNSNFNGSSEIILPTNALMDGRMIKSSGGGPILTNEGKLVGMITQEVDTDFITLIQNQIIDKQVINFYLGWNVFSMQFPDANVTEIGNYLKRSGNYSNLQMAYVQYDIEDANNNYYFSMEEFRGKLDDPKLRRYGGYLITDFVHGYNNVAQELIYNPFQPIYTGFKIYNPMKDSNMYSVFYKYEKKPIILLSVEFYNGYNAFVDFLMTGEVKPPKLFYVKDYIGKYYDQASIYNFIVNGAYFDVVQVYIFGVPMFEATRLPVIFEYLWNDGQQWHYEKESVAPYEVVYKNENNQDVHQFSFENPYPLYGIDKLVKHFNYL